MKTLIKKIGLLLTIVLLIQGLIYLKLQHPFSWGNKALHDKMVYLSDNNNYNFLFLGSSRINAHLIPSYFDEVVNESLNINSFNLGVNGMGNPNLYFVYEKLLKETDLSFNYAIIELNNTGYPSTRNLSTTRSKYWYDFKYWSYHMRSLYTSPSDLKTKALGLANINKSFGQRYLNMGLIDDYIKTYGEEGYDSAILGSNLDGYYSFKNELAFEKKHFPDRKSRLEIRYDDFMADTMVVVKRKELNEKYFSDQKMLSEVNQTHLKKLNELIDLSNQHNVHLFFIVTPRLTREYKEILPLFHKLDPSHRLEAADATKFPEYYQSDYTFDIGHLNEKGAYLFTKNVAEQVNHILLK